MTDTTMNTGAAPQQGTFDGDSEETRKAFREYDAEYPVTHRSHWQIWRDAIAYAHKTALATPTPQADAAPTFEAWAAKEGLISESHGVRFVNSMCDVARKAWDAAIAAGGAQEARYEVSAGSKWTAVTQAQYEAWSGEKRIATYTVLPRVAATVALTDEQREAIEWAAGRAHVEALGKPIDGAEGKRWRLLSDMFRAAASNGEQA